MEIFKNTLSRYFILILFFAGSAIVATEIKTGESVDFSGPVKEDLYAGAGYVTISSDVTGDTNLAGGNVTFKGKVTGDVQIMGGQIMAEIAAADDVRIMGGQAMLTIKNTGDVFLCSGDVNIAKASEIGGDVYVMGGKVLLDGKIRGNVKVWGGDVNLLGTTDGNLEVYSESARIQGQVKGASKLSSRTLTIQPDARFNGPVQYWSDNKNVKFHDTVVGGSAVFSEELRGSHREYQMYQNWTWGIAWFIGLLLSTTLSMFLFIHFMPRLLGESVEKIMASPVTAFGYGALYYLLVPALVILLCVTVIGIPHAMLLGALYAFSVVFARPVASAVLAGVCAKRYAKNWAKGKFLLVSLGIYMLMNLVFVIPFVGFIANMLVVGATMGAVLQVLTARFKASRPSQSTN